MCDYYLYLGMQTLPQNKQFCETAKTKINRIKRFIHLHQRQQKKNLIVMMIYLMSLAIRDKAMEIILTKILAFGIENY